MKAESSPDESLRYWITYRHGLDARDELGVATYFGATRPQLEYLFKKAFDLADIKRTHRLLSPLYRVGSGDRLRIGGRPRKQQHLRRIHPDARRWLAQMLCDYVVAQRTVPAATALIAAWRIFDSYLRTVRDPQVLERYEGFSFDVLIFASQLLHDRNLVVVRCSYCGTPEVVVQLNYPKCNCCGKVAVGSSSPLHEALRDQTKY